MAQHDLRRYFFPKEGGEIVTHCRVLFNNTIAQIKSDQKLVK